MSDMTTEKAREIVDREAESYEGNIPAYVVDEAQFFIDGHASRDPEVAELKAEVEQLRGALGEWKADFASVKTELSAEREASRNIFRTIAFFASVIKSGERWTEHCETAYREAVKTAAPGHSLEGEAR